MFYEVANRIDQYLKGRLTSAKRAELLSLIKEDPSYEDYFFRNVSSKSWLPALIEGEYFRPDRNPTPVPANEEGFYSIPEWNVLPYLEKVSQQVSLPRDEKDIDNLLLIIKNVSTYAALEIKHLDNYRTWWYFAKILLNLPNGKITTEVVKLIPIWLSSRFNTSLPGKEIAVDLLPKFLNTESANDIEKAEQLIKIITNIKWVPLSEAQRKIYSTNEEATTVIEPYWLKIGFDKSFEKIGRFCSIDVVETLAKKVLGIFCKQFPHGYEIDDQDVKYEISHALLENGEHQISVYLLKDRDGFGKIRLEKTLSFVVSDFYNQASFIEKVKETLTKNKAPILSSTELNEALAAIYSLPDYTYIGYNSLHASPDRVGVQDNEKILIYILKEMLAAKANYDESGTQAILGKFLSTDYPFPFFKRLVLFIVGKSWDKYRSYFMKLLTLEEVRWFEESDYADELRFLLKNNFSNFNSEEKQLILHIIKIGPQRFSEDNPAHKAYWRMKWLFYMKGDPDFADFYMEQKEIAGIEKFTPKSEVEVSDYIERSPLSIEEILKLSIPGLAVTLQQFRSEKKIEGMTVRAFAANLKEAVKARPDKFVGDLSSFDNVGFIYVYKILDGLREAWKEKRAFDWGRVFAFIVSYINKEEYWIDQYVIEPGSWPGEADHEWVTGAIAELIQEGTADDTWAFSEDNFEDAKEVVLKLLSLPEEEEKPKDYLSHALNTPVGKLLKAMVYLSLRIARVNKKKGIQKPQWAAEFKAKFDEFLDKKITDAFTSLGLFLPYLAYLDRHWAEDKVKLLSADMQSDTWEAFIDGYLSIGRFYNDLYTLMKPHYIYGLSFAFRDKHNLEHLVQHICIAFLSGREGLQDAEGLFRRITDGPNPELIKEVISFLNMQRDYLITDSEENDKIRAKIIEFWRELYRKYMGRDESLFTKEDRLILSAAAGLAVFLKEITAESCEWLRLSAPYVNENYGSTFFLEYIDVLKDRGEKNLTAKCVGNIYLRMLSRFTPDREEKHIRSTVTFLYDAGEKENADRICNIYGARGNDLLRDLYEQNKRIETTE